MRHNGTLVTLRVPLADHLWSKRNYRALCAAAHIFGVAYNLIIPGLHTYFLIYCVAMQSIMFSDTFLNNCCAAVRHMPSAQYKAEVWPFGAGQTCGHGLRFRGLRRTSRTSRTWCRASRTL